jgi:hypothetical protein
MGEEQLDLAQFLERLSDAQILLYEFARNPEATMRRYGLSDEDIALVESGDLQAIRDRVKSLRDGDILFVHPVHVPVPPPVHQPFPPVHLSFPRPVHQPQVDYPDQPSED